MLKIWPAHVMEASCKICWSNTDFCKQETVGMEAMRDRSGKGCNQATSAFVAIKLCNIT